MLRNVSICKGLLDYDIGRSDRGGEAEPEAGGVGRDSLNPFQTRFCGVCQLVANLRVARTGVRRPDSRLCGLQVDDLRMLNPIPGLGLWKWQTALDLEPCATEIGVSGRSGPRSEKSGNLDLLEGSNLSSTASTEK